MNSNSLNAQRIDISKVLYKKNIVVDTSSLLISGTNLLKILPKCKLVIPSIVVQELEKKRLHSTVGFLARQWLRFLEELRVQYGKQLSNGVEPKEYPNIFVRIEPNHSSQASLPIHLQDGSADSTILAVANNINKEGILKPNNVVIMSNDVPMRLHATLDLDIPAVEFNSTLISGAEPFDGRYKVDLTDNEYAEYLNNSNFENILNKLPKGHSKNAFIEIRIEGSKTSDYAIINSGVISPINHKSKAYGITGRTMEQDVAMTYLKADSDDIPIVSLGGSAGTGKTTLTIAVALDELKYKHYQKIIVFRSLHEMGEGQEMGFLPGGVDEKMAPWAGAIYDALDVIAHNKRGRKNDRGTTSAAEEEINKLKEMIEISPITYLRGRSLSDSFIVLEEAQNFSRNEILNILSRVGQGSKIVMTFDAAQVDSKYLQTGPDADIWSVIDLLKQEKLFAHITLQKTERSKVAELASRILEEG